MSEDAKLQLFSTDKYLLDRRGNAYASPVCGQDYTCEICKKVWDKFKRKHYMDTPDGHILGNRFWCDDCVEIIDMCWSDIMELYDKKGARVCI